MLQKNSESIQSQRDRNYFLQAKLAAQTIEVIDPSPRSVVGTAPYWCKETRSLYYCDLYRTDACTILRYCPADNRVYCATVDNFPTTTFIIPAKGTPDCFVVGANHTVILVRWDGKSPKAKWICNLFEVENCPEYASNNFDEGKADRYGRLYAGTYRGQICNDLDTPTYANLFRFSDDKPAVTLIEPNTVRASSGMAWDYKINKFYWIESCDWTVRSFDWCPYTGDICKRFHSIYKDTFSDFHIIKPKFISSSLDSKPKNDLQLYRRLRESTSVHQGYGH